MRTRAVPIELVKREYAAWPQVRGKTAKHGGRIRLKHQDIAADNRVKRALESQFRGIAFDKGHIRERSGRFACVRCPYRNGSAVDTDDFAAGANQIGNKKADVTGAASHIEYPHPRNDACFHERPARDRINQARLGDKALELLVCMTKDVPGRFVHDWNQRAGGG